MIEQIIGKLPGWAKGPVENLAAAAKEYGLDRAPRMAAAVAYRTVFALAPLLLIAVAVLGAFTGSRLEAQQEILDSIAAVGGQEIADLVEGVLESAYSTAGTAYVIGGLLLLWTASSLFLELQRDLNDIFDVPNEEVTGAVAMARTRGIGVLWVFGLGFLLIVTWSLNAIWRFLGNLLPDSLDTVNEVVTILTPIASVLLLPLVFGLIFQTMTAVTVPWRAVWVGAFFTSVVFLAAAYGVGVYFEVVGTTTALGFAGSFVVVLFLAYFLSSVFLFGAEVTKVYADRLEARSAAPALRPLYSDDPQVVVSSPPSGLPGAAFIAFLAGLVVGWRRRSR